MKSPQMSSKSGGKALCIVCGDESSGFHYGVDSCEGCKGFFRRCITQGMNHKCANEEKCEITPFTRNSCQYCRLKKCFEVGMSREASRLGRRPKRLKEVGGEGGGGSRVGNLPIAPYPAPQDMNRMRMEELQKFLQTSGSLKEDLMQAFLSAAKASFQEHSKSGDKGKGGDSQQEQMTSSMVSSQNPAFSPMDSMMPSTSSSSIADSKCASMDTSGLAASGIEVDSPSSLHSPEETSMSDLNAALDNFLFEQGLPSTPGGSQQIMLEGVGDLQNLNSPHNPGSLGLDSVSAATSPLSDVGVASPLNLPSSTSVTNGVGVLGMESAHLLGASGPKNATSMLSTNFSMNSQNSALPAPQGASQLHRQFYPKPPSVSQTGTSASSGGTEVKSEIKTDPVKTEPSASFSSSCAGFSSSCAVKSEPALPFTSPIHKQFTFSCFTDASELPFIDVKSIMEEVRQTPSESRRLLIEQVTDAVVDAHLLTTLNTYKSIEEANRRIQANLKEGELNPEPDKLKKNAEIMWQLFVSNMVPEITNVVRFCKKLPGFVEVEQDDQIRLIKQGVFEVMTTRFSLLVDTQNETLLDPTLTFRCSRDVVLATPMGPFLNEFFCVASKFRPLKLTDGEVGLFTSILIVCPSRNGLTNKTAIAKIQSLFQQALYILMKHNHPDADERFSHLMGLTAIIRRINEEHFRAINNIRFNLPEKVQFPELHREVFDISE